MTIRKHPLITNEYYHIFNRSVAQQPIFRNIHENNIFTKLIEYYHFSNVNLRFSYYSRLPSEPKNEILDSLYKNNKPLIEIFTFSLMPNHYHILMKQISEKGISEFVRLIQNSYAKYLNIKTHRFGALFQSPFKAIRIESDEQLLHVSRYIHLNPLTSFILKEEKDLKKYPWNSFIDYTSSRPRRFINTNFIKAFFKNQQLFEKFTFDRLDYQRKLDSIKHLVFE